MKLRTVTAIVLLLVGVPVLWVGGPLLSVAIAIAAAVALSELCLMARIPVRSLPFGLATVGMWALMLLESDGFSGEHALFLFGSMMFGLLTLSIFSHNKWSFETVAPLCLSAVYIGISCRYFLATRAIGFEALLFVLAITWLTDTGAFLVGSRIGRRKLAPTISPNKSVEGFLGGVACAALVGVGFAVFADWQQLGWVRLVISAIVVSVAGQIGDLVESALKRHYGVKDSGTLLPGHGGVLDRFDSLLFAVVAFHIILSITSL